VAIAPDQTLTTDEKAIKAIYDHSAIKTPFYVGMGSWKGMRSTLGLTDYPSVAPMRNNLIQCFRNKDLAVLIESIQEHVLESTDMLRAKAKLDESVNSVVCFRPLALDVVTDVL
jgi:chemotaxis protein histidine kinase CheA